MFKTFDIDDATVDKVYYRVLRHRNDTTLMANGNTVLHYLATFYIFFKLQMILKRIHLT